MKNFVEPFKDKNNLSKIESYLEKRNKRNRLIFIFGINSGLRISDILGLNIEDIKNKQYIEIKEKKTGKYKKISLNNKLQKLLKDYLSIREKMHSIAPEEPLFVGKKHKRLNRSQVYRFLNKAYLDLGITINTGTHSMRKSFGFHFYKQYNDIVLLQKILNHSSPSITLRYIGIAQEEIDKSYQNFEL